MNAPLQPETDTKFLADRAALEAEASGALAAPAADAPAVAAAPEGKTNAQVEREILAAPRKTSADVARDAIYAKAQGNRLDIDDSEAAMNLGVQRMLAETEGRPLGEPINTDAPARAEAPAAAAPAAAPALDRPENTITIHVDGREMQVSVADAIRAGVATMQKETSADYRLQRVSMAEQQIALERAALDRRAQEIEAASAATPTGASAAPANADLPSGGMAVNGALKQGLNALLDSDVDGAAQGLQRTIAETVAAEVARTRNIPQPAAAPAPNVSVADQIWPQAKRDEVNAIVTTAYPHIASNPALAQRFTNRLANEMANPVNQAGRVDLTLLALSIGQEFQAQAAQPPQPLANSRDELSARRTLAARVPGVPMPSQTRNANPPPGPVPPTRSEIVLGMKKARGQG